MKTASTILQNRPIRTPQFRFTMRGDSMRPEINPTDHVIAEYCEIDSIIWGESYLIQANEGAGGLRIIRKINRHPDRTKIILRAANPNFVDMVWPIAHIESIALVKGIG
jgi:hypothetical protein